MAVGHRESARAGRFSFFTVRVSCHIPRSALFASSDGTWSAVGWRKSDPRMYSGRPRSTDAQSALLCLLRRLYPFGGVGARSSTNLLACSVRMSYCDSPNKVSRSCSRCRHRHGRGDELPICPSPHARDFPTPVVYYNALNGHAWFAGTHIFHQTSATLAAQRSLEMPLRITSHS